MRIWLKLVALFLLFSGGLISAFYLAGMKSQDEGLAEISQDSVARTRDMFFTLEERDTKILQSALEAIARDPGFRKAYLGKDREKLYEYGQPLFRNLKNGSGITHFYFILPNGTVFVRMHNRDIYGDTVSRLTFQKARDTKTLATGLELGKTAFALRAVMPYYDGGELIGYVELGEEIDHFLSILKGNTKNEFAIIVDKEYLSREDWKSVRQVAGLRDNWDDPGKHVILTGTREDEISSECFNEENLERVEEGESVLQQIQGKNGTFACGGFLLDNARGQHIGSVLSLTDITDHVTLAQKYRQSLLITALILFSAFIAAGVYFAGTISRDIIKLKDAAGEIGAGNLDVKIKAGSGDELGQLARAISKMADNLKGYRGKLEFLNRELESKIGERTRELNEKISEMTDTKAAMLNMMEDADELNRELMAAQEKLEQNLKELKEADVKKNEFMSIAAHEIKTPITSIHGFAQLLQKREVASDLEKRGKYLKIMDRETARLAKLVNDILDLSRADLGTVALDISEVDASQVVDTVRTEMDVQMKAKGLKSEYNIEKGLPKIFTDKERLTQILMNLLNNAVKYTPKGKITLAVLREGSDLHFSVKDTGIGIAEKNWGKIFTRFYQVDSSYTRSAGGVGLGLSLCKEFVEILGGKIWFTSRHGKGSEFHFTLPIKGPKNIHAAGK